MRAVVAWHGRQNIVVVRVDVTHSEVWLARKQLVGDYLYQLLGHVQTVSFCTREEFDVEPVSWRQPSTMRRARND